MDDIKLEGNPFCPACFIVCDGVTHAMNYGDAKGPSPGDLSICYYCEAVLMFDKNLQFVLLGEDVDIPEGVSRMKSYMKAFKRVNPEKYDSNTKRIFDLN